MTRPRGQIVRVHERADPAPSVPNERGLPSGTPVRHRDVQRGTLRAAVFGVSDGLTTNIALILGIAAAARAASFVRLAGVACLLAGACSMAAGEYLSMRAQAELLEYELRREADELRARPDYEHRELAAIYRRRGLPKTSPMLSPRRSSASRRRRSRRMPARNWASAPIGSVPHRGRRVVLRVLRGSGALLPLLPWLWLGGSAAILASVLVGAVAALTVGAAVGYATGRPPRHAARQLALTAAAAGVTVLVGHVVGVSGA